MHSRTAQLGLHLNDGATLALAADKQFVTPYLSFHRTLIAYHRHFSYILSRRQGAVYVRKNYAVSDYPEELKNKVYLLKHCDGYIMSDL